MVVWFAALVEGVFSSSAPHTHLPTDLPADLKRIRLSWVGMGKVNFPSRRWGNWKEREGRLAKISSHHTDVDTGSCILIFETHLSESSH